jgi:hypothetical protein
LEKLLLMVGIKLNLKIKQVGFLVNIVKNFKVIL